MTTTKKIHACLVSWKKHATIIWRIQEIKFLVHESALGILATNTSKNSCLHNCIKSPNPHPSKFNCPLP